MVNAWSLLYDVQNGTLDEEYPIMSKNKKEQKIPGVDVSDYYHGLIPEDAKVPIRSKCGPRYTADDPSQEFWYDDGFSLTGNPAPPSADTISFNFNTESVGAAQPVPMSPYMNDVVSFDNFSSAEEASDWVKENGGYEYTPPGPFTTDADIDDQYAHHIPDRNWVYESPDGGKTVTRRRPGDDYTKKEVIKTPDLPTTPDNKNGVWKYHEDVILKEIRDYLSGTYRAHYTSQESKTQTLDLIEGIGDAEAFCRSNAIKYLSRFGKKDGKSKFDILKAVHYCILLYHFSGLCDNNSTPYETF